MSESRLQSAAVFIYFHYPGAKGSSIYYVARWEGVNQISMILKGAPENHRLFDCELKLGCFGDCYVSEC